MTYIREYFARVKVFVDIFTGKGPRSMEKTDTEPVSDVAKDTTREEKGISIDIRNKTAWKGR